MRRRRETPRTHGKKNNRRDYEIRSARRQSVQFRTTRVQEVLV